MRARGGFRPLFLSWTFFGCATVFCLGLQSCGPRVRNGGGKKLINTILLEHLKLPRLKPMALQRANSHTNEFLNPDMNSLKHHSDLAFHSCFENDFDSAWGETFNGFGLCFAFKGVDPFEKLA